MNRLALVALLAVAGCATQSYPGAPSITDARWNYIPSTLNIPVHVPQERAPAFFPGPSKFTAPIFQQREPVVTTCTYSGNRSVCTAN